MSHNTPFCPKCGRKMERIFRSNSETPRLFVCRECGHEPRQGQCIPRRAKFRRQDRCPIIRT